MVVRLLGELVATTQVGTRIPSERDLARDWGVARMTVRNAIGSLIKAGQLERRPGAGTFVVEAPYAKTLGLSSFTEDMRSRGHDPSNQLLEFAVQRYGADPIVRLGVDDDEPVYRFTRLRLADGQPIAVETNWIPVDVVPDLDETALDGSLFALLNDRYGIIPGEATSTIDAVLPDIAVASALGIGEHSPVSAHSDALPRSARPPADGRGRLLRRVALSTADHAQRQRLRAQRSRGPRLMTW